MRTEGGFMPIEGVVIYSHEDGTPPLTEKQIAVARRLAETGVVRRGGVVIPDSDRILDTTIVDSDGVERKIGTTMFFADFPDEPGTRARTEDPGFWS